MTFEDAKEQFPIQLDENGCWLWRGAKTKDGYGYWTGTGTLFFAHRQMFKAAKGSIKPGIHLDHLCRNRGCVNPDHLEPVLSRENVLRGNGPSAINARKTHCKRGHPFNEANTLIRKDGSRRCKTCYGPKRKSEE
jgi:HNH endonuclease